MRVFTVGIHSICHCNHYSLAYQFVCISESVMSAYGKHFQTIGEENKRACKLCKTKITFDNAKKHSTNLRNHPNRFNPETLQETSAKVPKITYYAVLSRSKEKYPNLSALDLPALKTRTTTDADTLSVYLFHPSLN